MSIEKFNLRSTESIVEWLKFRPIVRTGDKQKIGGFKSNYKIENFVRDWREGKDNCLFGLYQGLIIYALPLIRDRIEWDEDDLYNTGPGTNIQKVFSDQKIPRSLKYDLEMIWDEPPMGFEDYLRYINGSLNFDLKSALDVYRFQGDLAIPNILFQAYSDFDNLFEILPDKYVDWEVPVIDKYLSGTFFPCLVCPYPSQLRNAKRKGVMYVEALIDNEWVVWDSICVGNFPTFNRSLGERLPFFSSAGVAVKSYICYNYIDLVEASSKIKGSCVVRNLREKYSDNTSFIWGSDARLCVRIGNNNKIGGYDKFTNIKLSAGRKKYSDFCIINMKGDYIKECENSDVIFSCENILDFLELFEKEDELKKKNGTV